MLRSSLLAAIQDPSRAWLVFLVGLILIYREFTAPGRVLPGVLGGVAVVAAIYSLAQNSWSGQALILIVAGVLVLMTQAFLGRFSWLRLALAAIAISVGVHFLTWPQIGLLPVLLTLPLSGMTGFLLRTAVLARRNKVSIE